VQKSFPIILRYRIERNVSGSSGPTVVSETKSCVSTVLEYRSPTVAENSQSKFDPHHSDHPIKLPVVPPTMIGVCRLLQCYYILKVCIEDERKNESLEMIFPLTIATVPYRPTHSQVYSVGYGKRTIPDALSHYICMFRFLHRLR